MTEPRLTFEEHKEGTRHVYRFFEDRIERDWQGPGNSGTDVIRVAHLDQELTEQTFFGYGTARRFRRMVRYLVVGSVLHLGFAHPTLHVLGYISYSCAALVLVWLVRRLRRETWLYVQTGEGTVILTFREKGLKGVDRTRLRQEIQRYAENPKKPNEALPRTVTRFSGADQ